MRKLREIGLRLALFLVLANSPLVTAAVHAFVIGAPAPVISGEAWITSKPLTMDALKGRVVLVEFWTYG
ncbi:MAG TPA: hypothetical protein VJQ48_05660 [Candidatus Binatia bacterium]|nr:hypothetical protein [Candidatus Binatia bacterium]